MALEKLKYLLFSSYFRYKIKEQLSIDNNEIKYPTPKKDSYLLYIHIPFCKNLCPYCSFHKFAYNKQNMQEYFEYLKKEILLIKDRGFNFNALYIGGGTPTLLIDELIDLIEYVKSFWDIKEVSCESDPNLDLNKAKELSVYIDRLSVGIQSFDDDILKKTKRYYKFGSAKEQYEKISQLIEIFKIVNCDLIFGFPNQTQQMLEYDIDTILKLNPQQISYYPLMYSNSVKKGIEKNLGSIKNKNEFEFYKLIVSRLSKEYKQISAWAFAKSSDIFDEYVIDYDEYIGAGSGAFGFIDDTLYINEFSLNKYKELIKQNRLSVTKIKQYSKKEILLYRFAISLFGLNFDKEKFYKRYNLTNELDFYIKSMQFLDILDKDLNLTLFGKYIMLTFMKEFYIGMDNIREISRKGISEDGFRVKEFI